MEVRVDARENRMLGRFGNDRNVSGTLVAIMGVFGGSAPVSYTHLDVYKRQALHGGFPE